MKAWIEFLVELDSELGKSAVDKWLRSLKVIRFDAANLYLEAEEAFQISWFEEHVQPKIKEGRLKSNFRPIRVHFIQQNQEKKAEEKATSSTPEINSSLLDPEMSFDTFILSDANQILAHVIDEGQFNPIFIYGPKGSGKTHFLTSAAKKIAQGGKRVFFVSARTFTDHVVTAMRLGNMKEFRKVYRDIDVLLVDDVHLFAKKTSTQEEFFHTFNALQTTGRQIILTANKAPSKLSDIEPRLISRFEWGLSLPLEQIDPLTIIAKKCELWQFPLSKELQRLLIEKFPINPILALQALYLRNSAPQALTPVAIELLLKDLLMEEEKNAVTFETITEDVARHFSIPIEDLLGKSQAKEFSYPRQIAMYLCRKQMNAPFQQIGSFFKRDHSTVMMSVKQIQKEMEEPSSQTSETITELLART